MTRARYLIRLMFEWSGGCLWCGNDAAREQFDVGPIENRLPLSVETRQRLENLSRWHDTALNWDHPSAPSPWTAEDRAHFEQAVHAVLAVLRSELGPVFEVVYEPL